MRTRRTDRSRRIMRGCGPKVAMRTAFLREYSISSSRASRGKAQFVVGYLTGQESTGNQSPLLETALHIKEPLTVGKATKKTKLMNEEHSLGSLSAAKEREQSLGSLSATKEHGVDSNTSSKSDNVGAIDIGVPAAQRE
ncbi:hypothetical protein NDU88_005663 [Pleurodeles waltl]|uniref:Uncharacterized protein n=1 Tax=Pleurodeles waltl TaxID=8319 RepID=A0AAV7TUW9_PLEWA|nr:hypothetical protein NDU88_005663 [Pleurodeles waltl]